MKNALKLKIEKLAEQILITSKLNDVDALHSMSKELYENLTVLQFLNSQEEVKPEIQTQIVSETNIVEEIPVVVNEQELISALDEDLFVAEETVDSNLLEPATEKMIDIVAQLEPETHQVDDLFQDIIEQPSVGKNDMEIVTPVVEEKIVTTTKSLNDRLKKGITIGLNDRIAFVKHLFNDSTSDFNRVISQLNTLDSELEALEFLNNMVKPEYNNWENKEVYEQRFLSFIEGKY